MTNSSAREQSARLADLLRREHHALAEFLLALAEFDRRRVWVDLGYDSLFAFLTRELGLSAGAAYYRKAAAELIQRFPEIVEPLRDGRLCFTSIVELSKNLTPENRESILPRFFHVSKREAKAITAELQPVAEPPMRTIVTPAAPAAPETLAGPGPSLPFHPDETRHANASVPGVASAPPPAPSRDQRTQVEPLTADLSRMHVTVTRRLVETLATARDVLSHSHPGASDDEILRLGLDLIIERHAKRRGIGAKPRPRAPRAEAIAAPSPAPAAPASKRSRHVPAHVWRAVWERDQGRCTWPVYGGGVCGSTHKLQLDHVDGWALGAETTVERCRLLCAAHNDLHARELYGDEVMDRYTRPKRGPSCAEPVAAYAGAA